MADSLEPGAGKSATSGTQSGPKTKRRVQGGRVVESRYLQYEKKTKKMMELFTPAAASAAASGKPPEGRKASAVPRSKEDSRVMGTEDLQSTMLEGHGTAPPDLDLSAINDKSMFKKAPQLDRTMSKKAESMSFVTTQETRAFHKKRQDLQETMDMMESQTLLLTLLLVKVENNLALLEEKVEKELVAMCREKDRLQGQGLELRCQLLLQQKHQELAAFLDAQMEVLGPLQAVAEHFKDQYKTLATALDTTRHELPVRAIHMQGAGQELLDDLQPALETTLQLLDELDVDSSDASTQVPSLLGELKDLTAKKDLELHRIVSQVLELSSLASKEAALINQEVWEEAQGAPTCSPDALRDHSPLQGQA